MEIQALYTHNHKSETSSEIYNHEHSSHGDFHYQSDVLGENHDHDHDHSNHSKSHEEDDCCEDLANAIYSTLIKSEVLIIDVNAKLHALYLIDYNVDWIISHFSWYKKASFLYDIPPPPGREIRILILSFLN